MRLPEWIRSLAQISKCSLVAEATIHKKAAGISLCIETSMPLCAAQLRLLNVNRSHTIKPAPFKRNHMPKPQLLRTANLQQCYANILLHSSMSSMMANSLTKASVFKSSILCWEGPFLSKYLLPRTGSSGMQPHLRAWKVSSLGDVFTTSHGEKILPRSPPLPYTKAELASMSVRMYCYKGRFSW